MSYLHTGPSVRQAADGASEVEEQLRLALEVSGAEALAWSEGDEGVGVGARVLEWLGSPAPAPGRLAPEGLLGLVAPEDRPRVLGAAREHLAGRTSVLDVEFRAGAEGTGSRWLHLRGRVVARDAALRPLRGVAVLRDVTGQVLLAERLRQAERLAALGQAAAGIAHEVVNPLCSVEAYLELADETLRVDPSLAQAAPARALLRDAAAGAGQVREIVQGLRDLARRDAAAHGHLARG